MLVYWRLSESTRIHSKDFDISVGSGSANRLLLAVGPICEQRFYAILNIDLPGVIVGAPLTIPAVRLLHASAFPWGIRLWHVLTLPFFSLPAWWWIGWVYDRFRARIRPPTWQAVLASFLGAACIAAGIALMTAPSGDKSDLMPFFPGVVLWCGFFFSIPAVWLMRKTVIPAESL